MTTGCRSRCSAPCNASTPPSRWCTSTPISAPSPGGLLHHHLRALIHGLVGKGRLVGIDVVEIAPMYDHNDLTAIAAGRLLVNAIGAAAHAGHLDP